MNRPHLLLLAIPLAAIGCTDRMSYRNMDYQDVYVDNLSGYPIRVSIDDSKPSNPIGPHQTQRIKGFYYHPATITFLGQDGKQVLVTESIGDVQVSSYSRGSYPIPGRITYTYPPPASYWNTHSRYQP